MCIRDSLLSLRNSLVPYCHKRSFTMTVMQTGTPWSRLFAKHGVQVLLVVTSIGYLMTHTPLLIKILVFFSIDQIQKSCGTFIPFFSKPKTNNHGMPTPNSRFYHLHGSTFSSHNPRRRSVAWPKDHHNTTQSIIFTPEDPKAGEDVICFIMLPTYPL